jgi:hypothetical protein
MVCLVHKKCHRDGAAALEFAEYFFKLPLEMEEISESAFMAAGLMTDNQISLNFVSDTANKGSRKNNTNK